jgi:hypothetical protein
MPSLPSGLGLFAASVFFACAAPHSADGDEPAGRLAPIPATSRADDRIDPMRPVRLSASERERLFEQAARDAEPLERQALQL